ncbi:hypothetical protein NKR19_g9448 [Coniochaeta hoffmannii]|uniref:Uncharacterized protein n=1 Tax=Coniochaeta hoffmannii TaxID=91930 RepID=A0AA38RH85_9PEZI|nr:hypothetical protein NKR19_g9448 [Coniochaeta hoffmannii]
MSRKWPQDGDDARIAPNGSVRIAYDADTQTYTYRHPSGDLYEGAPGSEYGPLRLASRRRQDTNMATVRPAQPPAYQAPDSSPPPYSASKEVGDTSRRPQENHLPPAVTFDEILARHPTDNNKAFNRLTEPEHPPAVAAKTGIARSVSLRSIFGSRRRLSAANAQSDDPAHRRLGRRATTKEFSSSSMR